MHVWSVILGAYKSPRMINTYANAMDFEVHNWLWKFSGMQSKGAAATPRWPILLILNQWSLYDFVMCGGWGMPCGMCETGR